MGIILKQVHTVHGGDIVVPIEELEEKLEENANSEGKVKRSNAVKDERRRWPGGVVPYVLQGTFTETE